MLCIMMLLCKVIKLKVYGIENVLIECVLLVGNYNMFGLVDVLLLVVEFWEWGRIVWFFGDYVYFKILGWCDVLIWIGVVEGIREIILELMWCGEFVMVFFGGVCEVNKCKNECYKLVWKNWLGFVCLVI